MQFPWQYLGRPSNLSITVIFLSLKTPKETQGPLLIPGPNQGKGGQFALASICLGPVDPKQAAVAEMWQMGAEKWGDGRGFSWASKKVSNIPHARP